MTEVYCSSGRRSIIRNRTSSPTCICTILVVRRSRTLLASSNLNCICPPHCSTKWKRSKFVRFCKSSSLVWTLRFNILDIGEAPARSLGQTHLSLNPLLLHNDPKGGGNSGLAERATPSSSISDHARMHWHYNGLAVWRNSIGGRQQISPAKTDFRCLRYDFWAG